MVAPSTFWHTSRLVRDATGARPAWGMSDLLDEVKMTNARAIIPCLVRLFQALYIL